MVHIGHICACIFQIWPSKDLLLADMMFRGYSRSPVITWCSRFHSSRPL